MHESFIVLNCFTKIGATRCRKLLQYFGDLDSALRSGSEDWCRAGIESKIVSEFFAWRPTFVFEKYLARLEKEEIKYVTILDENYPSLLTEIHDAPPLLYYRGDLNCQDFLPLAVVGARQFSPYGEKVINDLIPDLVDKNFCIISGLARGIDSLAHAATLRANGKTMAVLGSGLNWSSIYPFENIDLARSIVASGGAVISEFPLDTAPLPINFPRRNRIVSGLSKGVLVVESRQKSGALITTTYALDQNREVLAVPGNIFSETSVGPNELIKSGAKVVSEVNDVLEVFGLAPSQEKKISEIKIKPELDEMEDKIFSVLSDSPQHSNEIARLTKLDTKDIHSKLSMLELRGIVKNAGGGEYILN